MLHVPTQSTTQALQFLFGRANGTIEVCGLGDQGKVVAEHFDTSQIEDAVDWLESISERGYRAYFGIQPRQEHLAGNGKRATDADVSQCVAIALDFDDGEALTQASNGLFKVAKPSMVIRTGTAPTTRAWVFWVFRDPETNDDWYGLAKELAHATGADPSATNPSRIGRAPGFYTLPPAKKKERGYINERALLTYIGERHDADWLRDTLTKWIENAQPRSGQGLERGADPLQRKVGKFSGLKEPLNVEALKQNCLNDQYWNESMFRLVGHWARQGLSDGDIIALSLPYTAPGYTPAETEEEVADMIARTRDRQGIEPVDVDDVPKPKKIMTDKQMSRGLSVKRPSDIEYRGQPAMAVEGLFPLHGTGFLVGDSSVGKSFFSVAMCVAVGSGQPFLGLNTTQAFCFYVGLEGAAELEARFCAAFKGLGVDRSQADFVFASGDLDLGDESQLLALADMYKAESNASPHGIIIIDTFSQATPGLEENSATDMAQVVRALTWLANETGTFVLACHHTNKAQATMRGSSALRGNVDTVVTLEKHETSESVTVATDKQRDGAPIKQFAVAIEDVQLRTADGEIGYKGYLKRVETTPKLPKLAPSERGLYQFLMSMPPSDWKRQDRPGQRIGAGTWFVAESDLMAAAIDQGVTGSRGGFTGLISKLVQKNLIRKIDKKIWPVDQSQWGSSDEF